MISTESASAFLAISCFMVAYYREPNKKTSILCSIIYFTTSGTYQTRHGGDFFKDSFKVQRMLFQRRLTYQRGFMAT